MNVREKENEREEEGERIVGEAVHIGGGYSDKAQGRAEL